MFKIISSRQKEVQLQDQIDIIDMFDVREQGALPMDSIDYDHEKSVYLIYRNLQMGLLVGVRLNPMTQKNLVSDTLQDKIKPYEKPSIWECSSFAVSIDSKSLTDKRTPSLERLSHLYYQEFQEALITACVRYQIGMVVFLHFHKKIQQMKTLGKMPFLHTIPLDKSLSLALFQNPYRH